MTSYFDNALFLAFTPELFLAGCIVVFLFINSIYCFYHGLGLEPGEGIINIETSNLISQVIMIHVGLLLFYYTLGTHGGVEHHDLQQGMLMYDESCRYTKILFVCISVMLLIPVTYCFEMQRTLSYEFFFLYLCILLSGLLLISSTDLIFTYLILELQTLALYILAAYKRTSIFSAESAIKYFFSGSFFSGIYLLGCVIIYFLTGTFNLEHILIILMEPATTYPPFFYPIVLFGIICIFCALLFKLSVAPFHLWAIDVYEGAPLGSTLVMAILPKLPIFYFLLRWLACTHEFQELQTFFFAVGYLSILVGGIMAIMQVRFKRLLIFSTVGQMGYIVLTLADYSINSASYSLFCLIIYLFSSIVAWSEFSLAAGDQIENCRDSDIEVRAIYMSDFTGLFTTNRIVALIFTVLFFSMSGIPGLVGFFGKTLPLLSIAEGASYILALLTLLTSSLSVYYTLRLIKLLYFDKDVSPDQSRLLGLPPFCVYSCAVIFLSTFLTALIIISFITPGYLILFCDLLVTSSTFF